MHFFQLKLHHALADWLEHVLKWVVKVSQCNIQQEHIRCIVISPPLGHALLPNSCPIDEELYIFHVTFCRWVCKWSMIQVSRYRSHNFTKERSRRNMRRRRRIYIYKTRLEWCLIKVFIWPSRTTSGDPSPSCQKFYHDAGNVSGRGKKTPPCSAWAKVLLLSHTFYPGALPIRTCSACTPTSQLERSRASLHPQPGLPSLLSQTISLINLSENL